MVDVNLLSEPPMSILRVGATRRKGYKRAATPELDARSRPASSRSVLLRSPKAAPPKRNPAPKKRLSAAARKARAARKRFLREVRESKPKNAEAAPIVCPRCGKPIAARKLRQHMEAVHLRAKPKKRKPNPEKREAQTRPDLVSPGAAGPRVWVCHGGTGVFRGDLIKGPTRSSATVGGGGAR